MRLAGKAIAVDEGCFMTQKSASEAERDAKEQEWTYKFGAAATGAEPPVLQSLRLAQLACAFSPEKPLEEINAERYAATLALSAIGPRNELEGMLAVQMIATHAAAMECMKRSAYAIDEPEARTKEMRTATKLLQLYTRQLDALAKLRASDNFRNHGNINYRDVPESIRNPTK